MNLASLVLRLFQIQCRILSIGIYYFTYLGFVFVFIDFLNCTVAAFKNIVLDALFCSSLLIPSAQLGIFEGRSSIHEKSTVKHFTEDVAFKYSFADSYTEEIVWEVHCYSYF